MSRDWQCLYSTPVDSPERLQSLPQHLNNSSLNQVFTYIAQEVAERLQPSDHFPVNRGSNPDETIAKRCCEAQIAPIAKRARIRANHYGKQINFTSLRPKLFQK